MTGIGPVLTTMRDRGAGEDKVMLTPSDLPRYLRKAKSIEELLPWLYLKNRVKRIDIKIKQRKSRDMKYIACECHTKRTVCQNCSWYGEKYS